MRMVGKTKQTYAELHPVPIRQLAIPNHNSGGFD